MHEADSDSIRSLIETGDTYDRITAKFGPKFGIWVDSACFLMRGWALARLTTDLDLVDMTPQLSTRRLNPKEPIDTFLDTRIVFPYPDTTEMWVFDYKVFLVFEGTQPITILDTLSPITFFPGVRSSFVQDRSVLPGAVTPITFPYGYKCLLELERKVAWPQTQPGAKSLYRMKANSPITPETEWHLVDKDCNLDLYPRESQAFENNYDVTRFYGKNGITQLYDFGLFSEQHLTHHVVLVSVAGKKNADE